MPLRGKNAITRGEASDYLFYFILPSGSPAVVVTEQQNDCDDPLHVKDPRCTICHLLELPRVNLPTEPIRTDSANVARNVPGTRRNFFGH